MDQKHFGCCSLACDECPAFIALKTNDDALRDQTAIEWTERYHHPFTREMINCSGCMAKKGIHGGYCNQCPVRACSMKKKNKGCYSCNDLDTCSILEDMKTQSGVDFRAMCQARKL
jgi:hypothetical protein